jgi:hypothetical protein
MNVLGLNPLQTKAAKRGASSQGMTREKADDLHILEAYRARLLPRQKCEKCTLRVKENSAVYGDCAEPHENPNLTHMLETRAPGFCSN